jgi:hypothetical protein
LPLYGHAGPLESELQPANTGEQRTDSQHFLTQEKRTLQENTSRPRVPAVVVARQLRHDI